mmetsp:Transcript_16145/g.41455  ORF Transcript_16145/g.41455 Transcript_16145/m.41455 type:complete len:228 (-) Transcript_16145:1396-2079(-)
MLATRKTLGLVSTVLCNLSGDLRWWRCLSTSTRASAPISLGNVSPPLRVPSHIPRPDHQNAPSSTIFWHESQVPRLTGRELERMSKTCQLTKTILNKAVRMVKPGVTTDEMDRAVHEAMISNDAYPSTLGYHGFPKSCCTSVNEVACHGIPDDRPLENGDIVNIDVSLFRDGYHGDCAVTVPVGVIGERAAELIRVARLARDEAIRQCAPGQEFSVIGNTVQYVLSV